MTPGRPRDLDEASVAVLLDGGLQRLDDDSSCGGGGEPHWSVAAMLSVALVLMSIRAGFVG